MSGSSNSNNQGVRRFAIQHDGGLRTCQPANSGNLTQGMGQMQRLLVLRQGETSSLAPIARPMEDDFDDDGSDDGILLMAKAKKPAPWTSRPPAFNPQRRNTNINIASTETANK
ncbi:hypothetical protein N0V84_012259, partial [Fusarium piperis]